MNFVHDIDKICETLAFECLAGNISCDLAERIENIDPIISMYGPTFWTFSMWAHYYQAQLYAIKLFDQDDKSVTIPFLLRQCCEQKRSCKYGSPEEVVKFVYESARMVMDLDDMISVLRFRRNKHIAHVSRMLTYRREELKKSPKLELDDIREILTESGRIVRGAHRIYCDKADPITDSRSDDIETVYKLMAKQLNAEADKREAEAAQFNFQLKVPRPNFKCED